VSLERELEQKRTQRHEIEGAHAEVEASLAELGRIERNSRIRFWLLVAAFIVTDAFFAYLFIWGS
jgi:hypothetical protein